MTTMEWCAVMACEVCSRDFAADFGTSRWCWNVKWTGPHVRCARQIKNIESQISISNQKFETRWSVDGLRFIQSNESNQSIKIHSKIDVCMWRLPNFKLAIFRLQVEERENARFGTHEARRERKQRRTNTRENYSCMNEWCTLLNENQSINIRRRKTRTANRLR